MIEVFCIEGEGIVGRKLWGEISSSLQFLI